MDEKIIMEAIKRIPGLPTTSRIKKELTDKFQLRVEQEEVKKGIEELQRKELVREVETTIKGNRFKGYKIIDKQPQTSEEKEKTKEEKIIERVFGKKSIK